MKTKTLNFLTCLFFGTCVLLAQIALTGEPPAAANTATPNRIEIKDFHFQPATLVVPAGATVVFVNRDEEPHTVASTEGKFPKSRALDTDQEYKVTLTAPGDYTYFCTVHPTMTGKITVKAP